MARVGVRGVRTLWRGVVRCVMTFWRGVPQVDGDNQLELEEVEMCGPGCRSFISLS